MNEYKVSVAIRRSSTLHDIEWKNHIVHAYNRDTVNEVIRDYLCGYEIYAIIFDSGIDWDKD